MQNYLKKVLLTSALILPMPLLAQETASSDLSKIEAETLVLKARERQLDVQAKIVAKQSEIASRQAETDRLVQSATPGNPVIMAIEGIGPNVFATLRMENGTTVDVQSGETLSDGMRVVSIKTNEVIIEDGKKRRTRLATASHATVAFDPTYPSVHLPALMPPSAP